MNFLDHGLLGMKDMCHKVFYLLLLANFKKILIFLLRLFSDDKEKVMLSYFRKAHDFSEEMIQELEKVSMKKVEGKKD